MSTLRALLDWCEDHECLVGFTLAALLVGGYFGVSSSKEASPQGQAQVSPAPTGNDYPDVASTYKPYEGLSDAEKQLITLSVAPTYHHEYRADPYAPKPYPRDSHGYWIGN